MYTLELWSSLPVPNTKLFYVDFKMRIVFFAIIARIRVKPVMSEGIRVLYQSPKR